MSRTSVLSLVFVALSLSATTGCAVGRIHESSMSEGPKYPTFMVTKDPPAQQAVASNDPR